MHTLTSRHWVTAAIARISTATGCTCVGGAAAAAIAIVKCSGSGHAVFLNPVSAAAGLRHIPSGLSCCSCSQMRELYVVQLQYKCRLAD